MLKIGDFSKLAQLSVKALRYYGELGLLKPSWIDRFTGYRYYTLDQLPRLNRILALKELGFSLDEIQQLLREDLSADELRGMMRLRHAELARQVQAGQERLARVQARLQQIEQEAVMPDYEVVLKRVPPQRVVGIRDVVPHLGAVGRLLEELRAYLRSQNLDRERATLYLAIYYDAEYSDRGIDAEVAAPITGSLRGTGRMLLHELPGVDTMACVVHRGSHEHLPNAYNTLMGWSEANGYQVIGPSRDVFLRGPASGEGARPAPAGNGVRDRVDRQELDHVDPDEYITEVQFPLEKKPLSSFVVQFKEKQEMEPKIVTKPAFTVVGMLYRGKNDENNHPAIAQMWRRFSPRMGEIQHVVDSQESFGVCSDLAPEGTFEYVAGLPVSKVQDVPEGMMSWEVPEQTYAVFDCTIKTIGDAYRHAFQDWLPGSGYERANGPDFERYDESFDPREEDPQLSIYIPIK